MHTITTVLPHNIYSTWSAAKPPATKGNSLLLHCAVFVNDMDLVLLLTQHTCSYLHTRWIQTKHWKESGKTDSFSTSKPRVKTTKDNDWITTRESYNSLVVTAYLIDGNRVIGCYRMQTRAITPPQTMHSQQTQLHTHNRDCADLGDFGVILMEIGVAATLFSWSGIISSESDCQNKLPPRLNTCMEYAERGKETSH